MQANSFRIALNGEVKFLEVLKFNAGFVLEVGLRGGRVLAGRSSMRGWTSSA
jgi:hypothetical protein